MNKVQKTENLLFSIAYVHDYSNPQSEAFRLKNPLMLKSYSKAGKHSVNEQGIREFESHQGGIRAAAYDILLKISGNSNTGLKPSDTLKNLLKVYGISQEQSQMEVVFFLRKCVNKDIDLATTLSYFDKD
jgi:hypothetical protein